MAKGKELAVSKSKFEAFAKGVERLKELENELGSMDTRGFAREESAIRTKLKKVSEISAIERGIKELRAKIQHKYQPPRKKDGTAKKIEKVGREVEKVEREIPGIKSGIRHISTEVGELVEAKKGPVDVGVAALVDEDFADFLKDVKVALSKRLRKKESEIAYRLKAEAEKSNSEFKKNYHEVMGRHLHGELEKHKAELSGQFGKKFNELRKQKEKLAKLKEQLVEDSHKRFEESLTRKEAELRVEMKAGENSFKKGVIKEEEKFKERVAEKEKALKKDVAKEEKEIEQKAKEISKVKKALRSEAEKEKSALKDKEKEAERGAKKEAELKLKKSKLDLQIALQKKMKKVLG